MSGLPGFSGHLVAPSFLARSIGPPDSDATSRWRASTAVWTAARHTLGPASSVRQIFDVAVAPLADALGLGSPSNVRAAGQHVAASIHSAGSAVVVIAVPWAERLDAYWRTAVAESQARGAGWCVVMNGMQLRVVDASQLYARRFVECDLPLVFDRVDSFAALLRLAGRAALLGGASDPASLHALVAASDRDAAGVCRSLRDGVLSASADVLQALLAREHHERPGVVAETFDQSLTIVYRVVFLLFAEARALVPVWHPVYRESYSVEALRETAERSPSPRGLWDALRAMARLAHAGCVAGDLRVTPFNGRLFAPSRTPLAERRGLDAAAARRAVLALSTRPSADRAGRERIAYRELGVEQLGAVYETLLDYRPRVSITRAAPGRRASLSVSLETGSGVRKATGTFYTPQPLADYLVRRTLRPLVQGASPDAILALRIVDPAMGSGAFLVSACRYLASAYEQALIAAGACHPADVTESDRTGFRRLVAERCLYGVDLNPMAVQLARLSVWLATLAADRPLSFLDHRLVAGDSLLGAWLRQLRLAPARRRRRDATAALPLFADAAFAEAMTAALPVRFSLELTPNDTIEQVRAKERAMAALTDGRSALARWKRAADVWCATWFGTQDDTVPVEAFHAVADSIVTGSGALPARAADAYIASARAIAAARAFFHWELEFPEAFFDRGGARLSNPGFHAVIGNPPWDMLRADAGEQADVAAIVRFTRDSGAYAAQSDGHANRYQLFVERAMALARAGGRVGLVLPSGLAADHGSAALRRHLLSRCDVDAIVGVENTRAIFPIHRSVRFLLVTATAGRASERLRCRFGVESTAELDAMGEDDRERFPVELTPAALERLSGPSLAIPRLQSAIDVRISEKAATLFAPLGSARGWSAAFGRELNATDDREAFRPAGHGWPIVDGKHLEPFRVATTGPARAISAGDARQLLGDRADRPRLAYRDVASATNRVTLIAAILPARTASTHTVFCLRTPLPLRLQHALCGFFNSLVVNYLVRLRVTTHVTTAIVEHLPIPVPDAAPAACREIGALARLLARRRDPEAFATLNARVAVLYQLTTEEFEHVLSTFPLVPQEDRSRALDAFRTERR